MALNSTNGTYGLGRRIAPAEAALVAAAAEATTDADRRPLGRLVGRRIVRTGFTLIMPR
ncbi:hypothetical protein J2Z21_004986 [Streptomyces griseochromogenes]|uniref:Uncharacterized protein n=1 Tax=Streptomyces griseochromogenes TaxID=68214 RepID=A0ABS4LX66_9ACTN|nr:hypothetical protein [Streptomyces griseochromogenes]